MPLRTVQYILYRTFHMLHRSWTGKLFTPRGLQGIDHLIKAELKQSQSATGIKLGDDWNLTRIDDLSAVSRLRIPQSIWVPLIDGVEVSGIADAVRQIESFSKWSSIPQLESHGPRVSISNDSVLSEGKNNAILLEALHSHAPPGTELSLKIDQSQRMYLSLNAIPPRPWLDSPIDLTLAEKSIDWWSVTGKADISRPSSPSESAIKLFRNESSLSCLCSAFVRASQLRAIIKDRPEVLIWDPFAGNASLLLEVLEDMARFPSQETKSVTVIGNVKSKDSLRTCERRVDKWISSFGDEVVLGSSDEAVSSAQPTKGGRKSRRKSSDEPTTNEEIQSVTTNTLVSRYVRIGNLSITVHVTSVPFQETIPYISGAIVMSHIPKSYNEVTGIDKYTLNEWGAFGSLLKGSDTQSAMFFTETGSFGKYSKLKVAKLAHLMSPSGRLIGHFSRWIPFK